MLGFCVPAPSLSGRSASLRVLPDRAAGRFLKHLIWRILLVIRRPVCGVESIFLPGLREGRSKPAGLVDEVAHRLAGEETAAVVEDDLAAPVVEIGAVACGCAASAAPPERSTACGRRAAAPARRRRGRRRRSAKRGDAAGDINARYGHDPGVSFYTHLSDQHGPYSIKVMSATNHEAPTGCCTMATLRKIDTHYTDTGGASDHAFILCALLGFRFCPRLRDLPERKLACIALASTSPFLEPLLGQPIKTDIIREHRSETLRLAASLKAGIVAPYVMLKKLATYRRQNQLDLALQELGRTERTLFMLDWLESPELRRRCHAGLNTMPGSTRASSVISSRRGLTVVAGVGFEPTTFRL
jgi:hypothetical protein